MPPLIWRSLRLLYRQNQPVHAGITLVVFAGAEIHVRIPDAVHLTAAFPAGINLFSARLLLDTESIAQLGE